MTGSISLMVRVVVASVAGAASVPALAQSLHERPAQATDARSAAPAGSGDAPSAPAAPAAPSLQQVSLYAVQPPKPRAFAEQDLVTIVISERSSVDNNQKLETKKDYKLNGKVTSFPELMDFLELQFNTQGPQTGLPAVGMDFKNDFKGDGKYSGENKVTARITARILEVKPNGVLLLESKSSVKTDEEEQVITVSGVCRTEDITIANTVQSNQMFDLSIDIQNTGQVKKGAKKGLITKVMDTLFNF